MAYPENPKMDPTETPTIPLPKMDPPQTPTIPGTNPSGGAPPLPTTKEEFVPFWKRMSGPEAPRRRVLHRASPWPVEDVNKHWGQVIERLADRMWERYKTLPAEQKALPAWQQVALNPQQAARSIVTRALMNKAQVPRVELDEAERSAIINQELFQWFHNVRRLP